MDLRQFRYFVQVARRENFRRAGDDLRVAQSALTRQIQRLENELGFLLFDRVKRGVRLTAAGQRLLERSQHILGEVDRLKESLQIEAHVPSGPVSLAAPPAIPDRWAHAPRSANSPSAGRLRPEYAASVR